MTCPEVSGATLEVSVAVRLPVASIVVGTSRASARAVVTGIAGASGPPRAAPPSRPPLLVEVVLVVVVLVDLEQEANAPSEMIISAQLMKVFERAL